MEQNKESEKHLPTEDRKNLKQRIEFTKNVRQNVNNLGIKEINFLSDYSGILCAPNIKE